MSPRKAALALSLLLALGAPASSTAAPPSQAPAPSWSLFSLAGPTNFTAGDESGLDRYEVSLTNNGAQVTNGDPITIVDTLPKGLVVKDVELTPSRQQFADLAPTACKAPEVADEVSTLTCEVKESLPEAKEPAKVRPAGKLRVIIYVATPASILPPGAEEVELINRIEVQGGGAQPAAVEAENQAGVKDQAPVGFQQYATELTAADGSPVTGAASHPFQYTTSFAVNLNPAPPGSILPFVPAGGDLKGIEVKLPPGLLPNLSAAGQCTAQEFNTVHGSVGESGGNLTQNECPDSAAVGVANIEQLEGAPLYASVPIYNLVPPPGMPAQFGVQPVLGLPVYIDTAAKLGPEGLAGRAFVRNITEAKRVTAARVTIWGTPADPLHDPLRGQCAQAGGSCPSGLAEEKPFLRLPTQCANPLLTTMSFDTWARPSQGASAADSEEPLDGCAEPDFSPAIEARPTTSLADSPSGLHFNLHLPQEENQSPKGLGEADLRDARVTLPPGLVANPAQADGLAACSPAQAGLESAPGQAPIVFDEAPAACPPASKVGRIEVNTPLIEHPILGAAYLAAQGDNPFGSLIALYFVLEDPQTGIVVKLASRVEPDPATGQLTATVTDNPQVPFEDFTFDFFPGARASLRTPMSCEAYATATQMTPWTAPQGPDAAPAGSFAITAGPAGPCPSGALDPKLAAGLANPAAGAYSPFHLRLTRADGTGELAGLTTRPPLGLTARLAGVPYCPEAAIAQALSRSGPGQGALELASPSCPPASRVGTASAGAGAGPTPFYAGGPLYLAGPYKGAPLSLVAVIPAVAGPFDLGAVLTRVAVRIDSETAQVTAEADPLPRILYGIPLDIRDIRVDLDRPNFALAPTSCEPKSVQATVLGASGAAASVSDPFQVGGCEALGFKPGVSLRLKGGTRRGDHPAFKAVVTYPKGAYANLARASVALPDSEFLENAHFKTICTRVQFAADACPKGSVYGKARATTPLLDAPLEGPVYLRSSNNPLPDIVFALRGQIDFDAVGRVDSHNGGIRTTFDAVPDAPLTKVVLEMQGGKKGLFVNSRDICKGANRATARLTAHNGKAHNFRPLLRADCKGAKGKKGRGKGPGRG
jgi:hypothetical protein